MAIPSGALSMRLTPGSVLSSFDPGVELRCQCRERQHSVFELHLMECAHVEALAQAGLCAIPHFLPFDTAKRISEHKPGHSGNSRHALRRTLRRPQRYRLLQVVGCLLNA